MLNELWDSTKSNLTDRLSSPLIGSFLVSWCLWNWRFLVILFSDASISQTFNMIESISFPDFKSILIFGVACPLITSLVYIFLYPLPARFVYGYTLNQSRKNNELRQSISKETLLTQEESEYFKIKYIDVIKKQQDTIQLLNEKIADSTITTNISMEEKIDKSEVKNKSTSPPLTESQFVILKKISSIGDAATQSDVLLFSKLDKLQVKYDLEELVRKKYLSVSVNESFVKVYQLSHEGMGVLLKS
jgi:hypothetical protein